MFQKFSLINQIYFHAISIDNSARVQILWKDNEKQSLLRGIVEKFDQDTGIPMLINTSFNRRGSNC